MFRIINGGMFRFETKLRGPRSHAVMRIKIQKVDKPPPGAKKGEGGRSTTDSRNPGKGKCE